MQQKFTSRDIAVCGMIAAIYTVLCLTTPWTSYGMVQVRIAEALTLLPVLSPLGIGGVTLGCVLSNLMGALTGMNPLGYIDAVVGSAATLLAGILSWRMRDLRFKGLPIASALAPVACNAVIVGAELSILFHGTLAPPIYLLNALYVGVGELIACVALGLPLLRALERKQIKI